MGNLVNRNFKQILPIFSRQFGDPFFSLHGTTATLYFAAHYLHGVSPGYLHFMHVLHLYRLQTICLFGFREALNLVASKEVEQPHLMCDAWKGSR